MAHRGERRKPVRRSFGGEKRFSEGRLWGELKPHRSKGGSHEVCSAHFAVVIEYKDQEQTTELRLPQDIIATLALEAEFRDMRIGELIGALIAATMEKDLLQLILDTEEGTKTPQTVDLREIRISPNK